MQFIKSFALLLWSTVHFQVSKHNYLSIFTLFYEVATHKCLEPRKALYTLSPSIYALAN